MPVVAVRVVDGISDDNARPVAKHEPSNRTVVLLCGVVGILAGEPASRIITVANDLVAQVGSQGVAILLAAKFGAQMTRHTGPLLVQKHQAVRE